MTGDPRTTALDLAVVLASTPQGRTGPRIADWLLTRLGAWEGFAISYGGISGGLRATEQLRPVLAELHAAVIRERSFHGDRPARDPYPPSARG